MEENTSTEYRWSAIEIAGFRIDDFAAHIDFIFMPLTILHFAALFIAASSLAFLLVKMKNPGHGDDENLKPVFMYALSPAVILFILSGAYLYFLLSVMHGAAFETGARFYAYGLFAFFYLCSLGAIIKMNQGKTLRAFVVYGLLSGVIISSGLIFVLSLGAGL